LGQRTRGRDQRTAEKKGKAAHLLCPLPETGADLGTMRGDWQLPFIELTEAMGSG